MQSNINPILFISLTAVTALYAFDSLAHKGGKANAGYVSDSKGHLVLDGSGKCLRTSAWSPSLALEECDPDLVVKNLAPTPAPKTVTAPPPAPAPAPELTPAPKPVSQSIALAAGALFDSGKSDIKSAGKADLDELVSKLQGLQSVEQIRVIGHTDSQGSAAFNQRLSEQRAQALKDYLIDQGIAADRIEAVGMGETQPVADNGSAEGRARNRRVELEIKAKQMIPQQ